MDLRTLLDQQIDVMAQRFQANRIFRLMGITFEEYLESPSQYDRISIHMEAGGGCMVTEDGKYHINHPKEGPKGGNCAWCGRHWTASAGGVDANDLCPDCRRNHKS